MIDYRTRITIVEDNVPLKDAFAIMLASNENYYVTNTYTNCEAALRNLEVDAPDIVLMDLKLPGMSGIQGIAKIKRIRPETEILVISVYEDSKQVFDALCAGASGYITKNTGYAELLGAIEELLNGGAPMSAKIASLVVKSFQRNQDTPLTPKETDVLFHLAKGKTYAAIADALSVSKETVKTHVKHIYEKLHVSNKSEAIQKAMHQKLI
ncbi:DNA-binding response regulator, NarL/FixJ family, contains REC and HTH domains [Catalinimonas alkaloidigena]|uniref:DNA-binding response regulator, NarL/FixJ family, contains REC and HTH domains n=1 Tax=Catalinimonas alkaloidigena TaxID=1075417 RepID=A0A1G9QQS0_9BACT|nr:response regulator transcription factor [Catalinimonas alkaloidigena]SDM12625.1 DNA-binding response regulator, NarL/FixJ family, contains REC and HTH domains [Catalinimonas alkaloidigena]